MPFRFELSHDKWPGLPFFDFPPPTENLSFGAGSFRFGNHPRAAEARESSTRRAIVRGQVDRFLPLNRSASASSSASKIRALPSIEESGSNEMQRRFFSTAFEIPNRKSHSPHLQFLEPGQEAAVQTAHRLNVRELAPVSEPTSNADSRGNSRDARRGLVSPFDPLHPREPLSTRKIRRPPLKGTVPSWPAEL